MGEERADTLISVTDGGEAEKMIVNLLVFSFMVLLAFAAHGMGDEPFLYVLAILLGLHNIACVIEGRSER